MQKAQSSAYINSQRRSYALYILRFRALPSVIDGLKAGGRRAVWTGRDGHKWKTANLAGAVTPIHPHAECTSTINTLTAPYGNNIPLFKGDGAFGTLMNPREYGAPRYTAVTVSKFTQEVMLRDIEIIPMTENYDGTLMEPVHFLPLVPVVLLNPSEGTALGFATNILPRTLDDIILAQIAHLKCAKSITNPIPKFTPIQAESTRAEVLDTGRTAYYFSGDYEHVNNTTLKITDLPYGKSHIDVINKLDSLWEADVITDYVDDSKDIIDITVKFKRDYLPHLQKPAILDTLGLTIRHVENLNVLDFTGEAVWQAEPVELIRQFTDWRLVWYVKRYERLRDILLKDLQRLLDIRIAIKNNVSGLAKKIQSRSELKEILEEFCIVNLDYIADLPVYRFTEDENRKNEDRIIEAEKQLAIYKNLLNNESERRKIYISELQDILLQYNKGVFNE